MAYIFWHSILAFFLTFFSGILSGIYSDILFGILSGIYSDIFSGILSGILSDNLFGIYSDILSGISSGTLSGILSDILSGICIWNIFRHSFWHFICIISSEILRGGWGHFVCLVFFFVCVRLFCPGFFATSAPTCQKTKQKKAMEVQEWLGHRVIGLFFGLVFVWFYGSFD